MLTFGVCTVWELFESLFEPAKHMLGWVCAHGGIFCAAPLEAMRTNKDWLFWMVALSMVERKITSITNSSKRADIHHSNATFHACSQEQAFRIVKILCYSILILLVALVVAIVIAVVVVVAIVMVFVIHKPFVV